MQLVLHVMILYHSEGSSIFFFSHVDEGLVLGQLQGNRFTITLRCGRLGRHEMSRY